MIDFLNDIIEYLKENINSSLEFDNVEVDKAYTSNDPIAPAIFCLISDIPEDNATFDNDGNPLYTLNIYCYGKKTTYKGELMDANDVCMILAEKVVKLLNKITLKENNENILSSRRMGVNSVLPLDNEYELYYTVLRYQVSTILEYNKVY